MKFTIKEKNQYARVKHACKFTLLNSVLSKLKKIKKNQVQSVSFMFCDLHFINFFFTPNSSTLSAIKIVYSSIKPFNTFNIRMVERVKESDKNAVKKLPCMLNKTQLYLECFCSACDCCPVT